MARAAVRRCRVLNGSPRYAEAPLVSIHPSLAVSRPPSSPSANRARARSVRSSAQRSSSASRSVSTAARSPATDAASTDARAWVSGIMMAAASQPRDERQTVGSGVAYPAGRLLSVLSGAGSRSPSDGRPPSSGSVGRPANPAPWTPQRRRPFLVRRVRVLRGAGGSVAKRARTGRRLLVGEKIEPPAQLGCSLIVASSSDQHVVDATLLAAHVARPVPDALGDLLHGQHALEVLALLDRLARGGSSPRACGAATAARRSRRMGSR
jgi:hypothetical protein